MISPPDKENTWIAIEDDESECNTSRRGRTPIRHNLRRRPAKIRGEAFTEAVREIASQLAKEFALAKAARGQCLAIINGIQTAFPSKEDKFRALADLWLDRTGGSSVIKYNDFAYLQIIGMGFEAVPLLLDRLPQNGHWIYALKAITGQQVEAEDMVGDFDRVVGAWINWGKANGYIR